MSYKDTWYDLKINSLVYSEHHANILGIFIPESTL